MFTQIQTEEFQIRQENKMSTITEKKIITSGNRTDVKYESEGLFDATREFQLSESRFYENGSCDPTALLFK